MELTRRQSLEDHELTHTLQSARLGPLMLTGFPLWGIELAADLTGAGGPQFSSYVVAELQAGKLSISDAAGFERDSYVQVAQNRRTVMIQLGPAVEGGFQLGTARERNCRALAISMGRSKCGGRWTKGTSSRIGLSGWPITANS